MKRAGESFVFVCLTPLPSGFLFLEKLMPKLILVMCRKNQFPHQAEPSQLNRKVLSFIFVSEFAETRTNICG
jgi:hypothetical protein